VSGHPPTPGVRSTWPRRSAAPDEEYRWTDDHWRVRSTDAPSGLPVVLLLEPRVHADLHDLPAPSRSSLGEVLHVLRIGDGAEHLHWCLVRPLGLVQARGSFAVESDDVLPPRPEQEWQDDLRRVTTALRG
jgi:hypothetical protein